MMNIKIVILGLLEPKPIIAEKDLLDSLTYGSVYGGSINLTSNTPFGVVI